MPKQVCSLLTEKDVRPYGWPLGSSLEQRLSLPSPNMCSFTSDVLHTHYVHWISSTWKGCDGPASLFSIKDVCGGISRYYSITENKNQVKYWLPGWWSQKRGEVERPQLNLQLLLHLNPRDTFLQTPYFFLSVEQFILYTPFYWPISLNPAGTWQLMNKIILCALGAIANPFVSVTALIFPTYGRGTTWGEAV